MRIKGLKIKLYKKYYHRRNHKMGDCGKINLC